jgi:hypothetical protein
MAEMRAMVVLAALLSLAMPGVSARTIELQSPISVTLSLKSPAASVPDIHRAPGKADPLHSFGSVPALYRVAVPVGTIERVAIFAKEPPSLDRHGPPLAPRPPPL